MKEKISNLSNVNIGQTCIVKEVNILNQDLKRHLMELGIVNETVIKVKKKAPLGDPIVIALRGYELFLPKYYLKNIMVENI